MSWVMHKNVAVAQRARAAFSSSCRRERSSPQKGSAQPHPLAFAAGKQGPARTQGRLQTHRQAGQHLIELRALHRFAHRAMLALAAETKILQQ